MIVVHTSAWVEYLRKTGSPANATFKRAVEAEEELGVVDVVRMRLDAPLLAQHRDFEVLGQVCPLRLV